MTNQVGSSIESATQARSLWRDLHDVPAQARMLLLLRTQYWKAGQQEHAARHVSEAITLLETLPPGRELAMAYSARAQLAMTADDTKAALAFGQRALKLAEPFEYHDVRSHALNNIGVVLLNSGNHTEGLSHLEQSLALAIKHNLQQHAARAYANLVSVCVRQHLHDQARRYVPEGIEYCETHEVQDCLNYIRAYDAHFALDGGNWEHAAYVAPELTEHRTLANAQRLPALVVLALVRARRGDPGVDPLLDEALRLAMPTGELQRIGTVAAARAEVAWYRGDLNRVTEEIAIGMRAATERREPWVLGQLAYWAYRADASFKAPPDIAEPYALLIEEDWEGAARAWERASMPYERALALASGPEEALREALTILESLGAGPLAAIVRHRLRELGARAIPRGPRTSTRENPAGLTSREVQVLTLLVEGHTNRELAHRLHISAKTVDNHVSSILEKLEVHSRTEAVAAAFGLGIVKPSD
jgi:ATP/maltotriose-dependent transcriptional regulator MalT